MGFMTFNPHPPPPPTPNFKDCLKCKGKVVEKKNMKIKDEGEVLLCIKTDS